MTQIICRLQHAKRGKSGFYGPDAYMVVVNVPEGGEIVGTHPLSKRNIRKYGWKVKYIGEFYSRFTGPKSTYAKLLKEAKSAE